MGDFVQTGGLLGLNDYAAQYGWRDRLPAGLVGMHSFSDDGTQFGGDQLYSMAYSGQWVGVYFNKSKLEALGLDVPSTFDEFLAAVDAAGAAGELPIQAGVLEQWPAGHVWMTFQNAISDPTSVRDFIFGSGDSFVTDSNLEAANTIAELGSTGAFGENFAGVSVDDAVAQFAQGNGVFFIQGTWFSKTLSDAMGDNVGVFPMPRLDEGPAAATASPGYGYSITAQSGHHDLAAEYLDFITGPRSAEILLELGSLPVLPADGIEVDNPLLADILAGWTVLAENDTMLPFLDWAAPPLLADLGAASQELMAGRTSPEDFLARVDSDYQDFIAES